MSVQQRFFLLLLGGLACSDPCSGVIDCATAPRIAASGRLINYASRGVGGASLRLIATYPDHVDSAGTVSDDQGLFSLGMAATGSSSPRVSLRVLPVQRPGYLVTLANCGLVTRRGDACVLNPLLDEPIIPFFQFFYRGNPSNPVDTVQLTFSTSASSPLFFRQGDGSSIPYSGSFSIKTGTDGIATLLPLGVWTGNADSVVGDLAVEFRAPIGKTVIRGFKFAPSLYFGDRTLVPRFLGPSLSYRFDFSDSATGAPLPNVEMRFRRTSGVATRTDSFDIKSGSDGKAFFGLVPESYGTVTGNMSIKAAQRPVQTDIAGMSFQTFDLDSSILFAAWRVGATGILYPKS